MPSVDWNNSEERNAYYRTKSAAYRQSHPRLNLSFHADEFEILQESAQKYGIAGRKLARHAKLLVLEAARLGLGEQIERPPQLPPEVMEDLKFLLNNAANNINQIAYQLNTEALERPVGTVLPLADSQRIIDEIFTLLKDCHTELKALTQNYHSL